MAELKGPTLKNVDGGLEQTLQELQTAHTIKERSQLKAIPVIKSGAAPLSIVFKTQLSIL